MAVRLHSLLRQWLALPRLFCTRRHSSGFTRVVSRPVRAFNDGRVCDKGCAQESGSQLCGLFICFPSAGRASRCCSTCVVGWHGTVLMMDSSIRRTPERSCRAEFESRLVEAESGWSSGFIVARGHRTLSPHGSRRGWTQKWWEGSCCQGQRATGPGRKCPRQT